jgi:hypothetical protein
MAAAIVILIAGLVALPAHAQEPKGHFISTLDAMYDYIGSCWRNPEIPRDDPGMRITVRFAVKRNGELIAEPRIIYESEHASEETKQKFRAALAEAMQRCIPLPISDSLGNVMAGRPISFQFDARRINPI